MVLSIPSIIATQASTLEANPFGSTLTLPVGVYQLNYQYRFRAAPSTTTVMTALIINNALSTPQSGPKNYGFYVNNAMNVTLTGSGITGSYCMGGSSIIVNTTPANVLTPVITITYTPVGSLQFLGSSECFVAVTRIG